LVRRRDYNGDMRAPAQPLHRFLSVIVLAAALAVAAGLLMLVLDAAMAAIVFARH
jgi:hypothetical protein